MSCGDRSPTVSCSNDVAEDSDTENSDASNATRYICVTPYHAACNKVSENMRVRPVDVHQCVFHLLALAAQLLKIQGSFNFADILHLKLKHRPATKPRKVLNPVTKKVNVKLGKPASNTVIAMPMKKLREMVN